MEKGSERIAWHYTVGERLSGILSEGVIRPATAHVPEGVRPAVWLSLHGRWEETANKNWVQGGKMIKLDRAGTARLAGGLARIGVLESQVPLTWRDYKRMSGESGGQIRRLEKSARAAGSDVKLWRVSFDPVPRSEWEAIELFKGGAWAPRE